MEKQRLWSGMRGIKLGIISVVVVPVWRDI